MSPYLTFAKKTAYEAGKIMSYYFTRHLNVKLKKNITPLTIADTQINSFVIQQIQKNFPQHSIIAEEGSKEIEGAKYEWICDPIDGTMPFALKIPTCMFSLALYRKRQPVLGVLYDPFLDKLYSAEEEKPTLMNNKKIWILKGALQKGDPIGIINQRTFHFGKLIPYIYQEKRVRTEEIHSITYLMAAVAEGRLKGVMCPAGHAWDIAASTLILKNAGGMMTDSKGKEVDIYGSTDLLVVSNGDCHQTLLDWAKKYVL